jgi:hypothetical protein
LTDDVANFDATAAHVATTSGRFEVDDPEMIFLGFETGKLGGSSLNVIRPDPCDADGVRFRS